MSRFAFGVPGIAVAGVTDPGEPAFTNFLDSNVLTTWTNQGVTVTSEAGLGPSGDTVFKLVPTGTLSTQFRSYKNGNSSGAGTGHKFSYDAKAVGVTKIHARFDVVDGTVYGLGLDLTDGSTFTSKYDGTTSTTAFANVTSTELPNGWWRIEGEYDNAGGTNLNVLIYLSNSEATTEMTGDSVIHALIRHVYAYNPSP